MPLPITRWVPQLNERSSRTAPRSHLVAELALPAGGLLWRLSLSLVDVLDVVQHPEGQSLQLEQFFQKLSMSCNKGKRIEILIKFGPILASFGFISLLVTLANCGNYENDGNQETSKKKYFSFYHIVKRKKPSFPSQAEIWTHNLWIIRHALYHCATTTTRGIVIEMEDGENFPWFDKWGLLIVLGSYRLSNKSKSHLRSQGMVQIC